MRHWTDSRQRHETSPERTAGPRCPRSAGLGQSTRAQAQQGDDGDDVVHDRQPPPFPPFTVETATQKVQAAEDAWNTRDPHHVSLAYTVDSQWRNRDEHIVGRDQIVAFLTRKWQRELDYTLRKSLWDFHDNRIAVRFQYECRDHTGQWYRSYGNELWEFTPSGLMARREASINDVRIAESERRWFGPRPASEHIQDIPLW